MGRLLAKWTVVAVVAVFMLGFMVSLADNASAKTTKLTFWSWRTEDRAAYEKFIKEFETAHPDIQIQFVPYKNTEYNTILATALQGGSGPDVMQLRAYGGMEPLANAGYLVPLDGKIKALSEFPKATLGGAANRRDKHVYGVPFAVQTIQVLYNKAVFTKLGLTEPQTWSEFLQTAAKVKKAGYIPFANGGKDGWTLETFFGAVAPNFYGGSDFFDALTSGEKNFQDPKFIASIKKMLELRPYLPDNYMGVGYTDMQMMFAQEMAAMWLAGSYELGTMKSLNPKLEMGVFVVPPDKKGDPTYMSTYVDGSYGINAASKHQEEALEFVKWLATKEYGQMFTDELAQISAVPGTKPSHPVLAEMVRLMRSYQTPYLMLTGFRYGQPSGSTLLQNDLQGVFAGKLTPEEAAADIQQGLARWHEPFKK